MYTLRGEWKRWEIVYQCNLITLSKETWRSRWFFSNVLCSNNKVLAGLPMLGLNEDAKSRTLAIFSQAICQRHNHLTEWAITRALLRYYLSTTSTSLAKRNQNWEMQKQTGFMRPSWGSFKMNLEVNKGGNLRATTTIHQNWFQLYTNGPKRGMEEEGTPRLLEYNPTLLCCACYHLVFL